MSVALPTLRVGEPIRHEALSVFPLFADSTNTVDYRLSDAALSDQSILIKEINEAGSVPELLVENQGDLRVLFLEGEELVGAKQNRIVNTSVLVAAHSKVKIPVSCVEQGRWGYQSRYFGSSGSQTPTKLRRALKASVSQSLRAEQGYRSDQGRIWKEVERLHAMHGVKSGTGAMSDAFTTYQAQIAEFRKQVIYVDGAVGIGVAIGGQVVSVDVFDKPATCQKVWDRLLSGMVFDAMEAGKTNQHSSVADVERLVATAGNLRWESAKAVGEGEEFRAATQDGDQASMLAFEQVVVHGSVVSAK